MTPNELGQLTPLAETLNRKSDEINQTLTTVNAKLAELNIGVEVWLGPWEGDRDPYQIGFAKIGDAWQLSTRSCEAEESHDSYTGEKGWRAVPGSYGPAKAVLQASRNVRIATLELLPTLINELKEQIERKVKAIEEAKQIAAEL
jgi:hypothetical protein